MVLGGDEAPRADICAGKARRRYLQRNVGCELPYAEVLPEPGEAVMLDDPHDPTPLQIARADAQCRRRIAIDRDPTVAMMDEDRHVWSVGATVRAIVLGIIGAIALAMWG
jgi:hypothetical protein